MTNKNRLYFTKKFLLLAGFLSLFFVSHCVVGQNIFSDTTATQTGVFPKSSEPELYNFKVSGVYRFFSTMNIMKNNYVLNALNSDTTKKRNIFVGDDSQLPNLILNFSGKPDKNTFWGFDLYVFQFLNGEIKTTYGNGQVPNSKRPPIFNPRIGARLGTNMGLLLGMNLYGSINTGIGTFSLKTGGIHWTSITDLTLGAFTGYNRFILFERNPWDPINSDVQKRYKKYFESGNINQDQRWGERAFTGTIIENANLPHNFSCKLLYGKTELNGGFLSIPNLSYGGQLKKDFTKGSFAFNSFNNITYTDSLSKNTIGFNVHTAQLFLKLRKGIEFKSEFGMGQYFTPINNTKWGEAITAKLFFTKELVKIPFEIHAYRINPNVVNNNAIFWNTAVKEYNNNIPAGTVGSNAVLLPFASALTAVGQFTNNRQGININTEYKIHDVTLSLSNAIAGEIQAITKTISYSHPVNQLTRSRFWRWTFPTEVGPYQRYNKIYRDAYEKMVLNDISAKRFNTIEFQAKTHTKFMHKDLYIFVLGNYSSIQKHWSPVTVFTEKAYLRHYTTQLETYYSIKSKIILAQYVGFERIIANYETELNPISRRPRNQQGIGYALGLDIELEKNTMFYIRHRWYGFEDKSFVADKFSGREWIMELKVAF